MTPIHPTPKTTVDSGRRRFIRNAGVTVAGVAATYAGGVRAADTNSAQRDPGPARDWPWSRSLAIDPTDVPAPIRRDHSTHHEFELVAREVEAKLDDGSTHAFMTWNNSVPGPMLRVRQDDTVTLTVSSAGDNKRPHNVDLHAVYGIGGGANATYVAPGQRKKIRFKCVYPGAFIYHCAVPTMDEHISRGMFGMIVVEPHDGLPVADREFYLGQHELYTQQAIGSTGRLEFDREAMKREQPNFVLFSGAVNGFTPGRLGPLSAKTGETARVFMVSGGPNLSSSFHPIGNVWSRCWPDGALADRPRHYVQTQSVPPGSCFVGDMKLPQAETIKLVDHALSRSVNKGVLAHLDVAGETDMTLFEALS
ncbi:copper-containing nitrite reductase [Salinisphaera orenii]|uniref:copper-containing nitrite reductase n=1 Tax=Salinisphaera orenii TaxID=856731 RepID=UPI000DBE8034